MNHFLVRLGKTKHIELAMPLLNCTITTAYVATQFGFHGFLRDILVAQSPSGCRVKIETHLRNLITETHDVCLKNGWCNFDNPHKFIDWPKGKIKWFASSASDPVTFGSTRLASGLLIGLPAFYNYTRTDDIPDHAFQINRMALFRSTHDKLQEERSKIKDEGISVDSGPPAGLVVRRIEKESEEGSEYADSLILSEDAKRFSIAREMFYGDSYHPFAKAAILFVSLAFATALGRFAVLKFRLREYHITNRFAAYIMAGSLGSMNYRFLSRTADQYFAEKADNMAKALGANYESGAEEYYAKRARRRKILGLK